MKCERRVSAHVQLAHYPKPPTRAIHLESWCALKDSARRRFSVCQWEDSMNRCSFAVDNYIHTGAQENSNYTLPGASHHNHKLATANA